LAISRRHRNASIASSITDQARYTYRGADRSYVANPADKKKTLMNMLPYLAPLLLGVAVAPALACDPHPLKDSDDSFAEAVAKRFARSGITDVDPVTHVADGATVYVLLGSNVRLMIRDDGGYPTEIGTVLSEPSSGADRALQAQLIGFTLTRMGGGREAAVAKSITASLAVHGDSGTWSEKNGDAIAVITRSPNGLVAKMGVCR
jgi:hypothetical protein